MSAYAYEEIVVEDTAKGLTGSYFDNALSLHMRDVRRIYLTVEEGALRFRVDGGEPGSSVGHELNEGDALDMDGTEGRRFRVIRSGTVSGKLRVTYEI